MLAARDETPAKSLWARRCDGRGSGDPLRPTLVPAGDGTAPRYQAVGDVGEAPACDLTRRCANDGRASSSGSAGRTPAMPKPASAASLAQTTLRTSPKRGRRADSLCERCKVVMDREAQGLFAASTRGRSGFVADVDEGRGGAAAIELGVVVRAGCVTSAWSLGRASGACSASSWAGSRRPLRDDASARAVVLDAVVRVVEVRARLAAGFVADAAMISAATPGRAGSGGGSSGVWLKRLTRSRSAELWDLDEPETVRAAGVWSVVVVEARNASGVAPAGFSTGPAPLARRAAVQESSLRRWARDEDDVRGGMATSDGYRDVGPAWGLAPDGARRGGGGYCEWTGA